ncbi:MAG: helix-turn-helix transcriptional regulator [Ilumatobacteraceae bacterium]
MRLAGTDGVLTFHASASKGLDGAMSIVVERPRPVELAPMIMSAFGYTNREREVVQRALQGAGRGTIARDLGVSEDTVGQHLTSAYRKASVGTQAELAAMLFGSFYETPRGRHAPPSPYGHFLPTG